MTARLYVDGYNFYYAVKYSRALRIYLGWCDFRKLGQKYLLPKGETLGQIKYFTARVAEYGSPGEKGRQSAWLRAVHTIPDLIVIFGFHQRSEKRFREEKQTDVNIAVQMVMDACRDPTYDRAVLISADIDLAPAVSAVATSVPLPRDVDVWFPPGQEGNRWKNVQVENVRCRALTDEMLEGSRLPEEIHHEGKVIRCIPEWRRPR